MNNKNKTLLFRELCFYSNKIFESKQNDKFYQNELSEIVLLKVESNEIKELIKSLLDFSFIQKEEIESRDAYFINDRFESKIKNNQIYIDRDFIKFSFENHSLYSKIINEYKNDKPIKKDEFTKFIKKQNTKLNPDHIFKQCTSIGLLREMEKDRFFCSKEFIKDIRLKIPKGIFSEIEELKKNVEPLIEASRNKKKIEFGKSKYFDDDIIKQYLNKDEYEINSILNTKQKKAGTLKYELKAIINSYFKLNEKNKALSFWKRFPFWSIFILIIISTILIIIKELIFRTKGMIVKDIVLSPSDYFILYTIITLIILTISILFIIVKYVRKSGDDINKENRLGHNKIKESIETYLKPSVSIIEGLPNVIKEATEVLSDVMHKKKDAFIYYFGAPSLSSLEDDEDLFDYEGMTDDKLDDVITKTKEYAEAKRTVNNAEIKIERYIKIILEKEISKRSPKMQKRYKKWLEKQLELLNENSDKYKIFNATRAPRWGSTQSYIITNQSYLHIIGQGNAAIHIKGEQLVENILTKMKDAITDAIKESNRPQAFKKNDIENLLEKFEKKSTDELNEEQKEVLDIENDLLELEEKDITLKSKEVHREQTDKKLIEIFASIDETKNLQDDIVNRLKNKLLSKIGDSGKNSDLKGGINHELLLILKKMNINNCKQVEAFDTLPKIYKKLLFELFKREKENYKAEIEKEKREKFLKDIFNFKDLFKKSNELCN